MLAGSIYMFAGSTVPDGLLECDGSAVSRSTYADLFDVIGTTYGAGDGSTTFNLPNLSGRVAIGSSVEHLLGTSGGSEAVSLTSNQIPSHSHEVPTHGHGNDISVSTPSLSHSVTTQPAFNYSRPNGTNTTRNASDGNGARSGTTSTAAAISTNCAVEKHPATACTMSGGVTDCAEFDTESTGSGTPHNNMQPYVTMMYVIATGA